MEIFLSEVTTPEILRALVIIKLCHRKLLIKRVTQALIIN
jgi:hypothetical protein